MNAVLEISNISKTFPGVKALYNVSLDIFEGKVHAIVGENGAGKSTLMKILLGMERPDSGEIRFNGKKVIINNPAKALEMGISMIHQDEE